MRDRRETHLPQWLRTACVTVGCMVACSVASAQPQTPRALRLVDAVALARRNYPAVKELRARAEAAEQAIAVARTSYLPRLDGLWQVNRATRNNVFGLLLPQGVVPPISGPVLGTTRTTVYGAAPPACSSRGKR